MVNPLHWQELKLRLVASLFQLDSSHIIVISYMARPIAADSTLHATSPSTLSKWLNQSAVSFSRSNIRESRIISEASHCRIREVGRVRRRRCIQQRSSRNVSRLIPQRLAVHALSLPGLFLAWWARIWVKQTSFAGMIPILDLPPNYTHSGLPGNLHPFQQWHFWQKSFLSRLNVAMHRALGLSGACQNQI